MTKEKIIDSLYKVICSATHTRGDTRVEDNDYFKRRVLGFGPELAFEDTLATDSSVKFLEGGQFISKKLTGESDNKNTFIYTTISFDDSFLYEQIYEALSKWEEVEEMWFIKILEREWSEKSFRTRDVAQGAITETTILEPAYEFFKFNKTTRHFERPLVQGFAEVLRDFEIGIRSPSLYPLRHREKFNYFNEIPDKLMKKVYGNRYFLDVILRKAKGRQIIDLDGFIVAGDKTIITEIKEKTPIFNKSEAMVDWQYGWDTRRLVWYFYLQERTGLPVLYNIHRIIDRNTREFVQWDSVFLDDFLKGVTWSGGRSGGGGEDTLLAPYLFFKRLEDVLIGLND